jgi:hypothetical protein
LSFYKDIEMDQLNQQVCFKTDYFVGFVIVTVGIIAWILYYCYRMALESVRRDPQLETLPEPQPQPLTDRQDPRVEQPYGPYGPYGQYGQDGPYSTRYGVQFGPQSLPVYGSYGPYQLIGYASHHKHPDRMFRLMGRQYNSTRYEYYVVHPDTAIKIPIKTQNDHELNSGDRIRIPGFHGHFTVRIYEDNDHLF